MRLPIIQTEEARRKITRVGNSSGDENGRSDSMKYWEIIADKLHASGWSWGYCSAVTKYWRWIVDTLRGNGRRYIVQSDELLSAFLELKATLLRG